MNTILISIVNINIWIKMYRFFIITLVVGTALADVMDKKLCGRVFHPNAMRCCKNETDTIYKVIITDELSECFQVSKDPVSCEREICIAQKKGFATDDNNIDKNKLEVLMTKDFGSDPPLLVDIKSECLNGKFDKYAPHEFCNFMKMRHCVSMQILNHCVEWKGNGECQEVKRLVAECVKFLT